MDSVNRAFYENASARKYDIKNKSRVGDDGDNGGMASSMATTHPPRYSCPFRKRHPVRHNECSRVRLSLIEDVKTHLKLRHTPEFYCKRCLITFQTDFLLKVHLNHQVYAPCEPLFGEMGFVSREQAWQIFEEPSPSLSSQEQWFRIWDIIFPGSSRPASTFEPSPGVQFKSSRCDTCRQRRLRCDNLRPVCGQCMRINRNCSNSSKDEAFTELLASNDNQSDGDVCQTMGGNADRLFDRLFDKHESQRTPRSIISDPSHHQVPLPVFDSAHPSQGSETSQGTNLGEVRQTTPTLLPIVPVTDNGCALISQPDIRQHVNWNLKMGPMHILHNNEGFRAANSDADTIAISTQHCFIPNTCRSIRSNLGCRGDRESRASISNVLLCELVKAFSIRILRMGVQSATSSPESPRAMWLFSDRRGQVLWNAKCVLALFK